MIVVLFVDNVLIYSRSNIRVAQSGKAGKATALSLKVLKASKKVNML